MSDRLLSNKIALVTGGASGIGFAAARLFAEEGAQLILADKDPKKLMQAENWFAEHNYSLLAVECDVCDSSQVASLMAKVQSVYGHLDVLVNNVGDFLGRIKPFVKMTDDDIDDLFSVNLRQLMICTRDAIPLLKQAAQQASIICISSIEGYRGMPNIAPYGAYKLGIEGFVKSIALELGPDNIRVNAIAPETTETDQVQPKKWISEANYPRVKEWIPLGRFGQPDDIAGSALFLASRLSQWITGTVIHCDGGALAAAGWYRTPEGAWTNTPVITESGIMGLIDND